MLGGKPLAIYLSQLVSVGMIKDRLFKTLSIPMLGVIIPLLSKLIRYPGLSWMQIITANMIFIATSYIIWEGSVYIVSKLRRLALVKQKFFLKLADYSFFKNFVYGKLGGRTVLPVTFLVP